MTRWGKQTGFELLITLAEDENETKRQFPPTPLDKRGQTRQIAPPATRSNSGLASPVPRDNFSATTMAPTQRVWPLFLVLISSAAYPPIFLRGVSINAQVLPAPGRPAVGQDCNRGDQTAGDALAVTRFLAQPRLMRRKSSVHALISRKASRRVRSSGPQPGPITLQGQRGRQFLADDQVLDLRWDRKP
jgi:hypothetical protein